MLRRSSAVLSCALLVLSGLLAGCAEAPRKVVTPLTLDYTRLGHIKLAVATVDFVNHSPLVPGAAAGISDDFKPRLADAAYRWGVDRLHPVGAEGKAIYKISQASITRSKLPLQEGVSSWFTRQQAEKWQATLTVELVVTNAMGGFSGSASATVSRTTTLPEDANPAERENAYRRLLLATMDDINAQLNASINAHLKPVLATAP